MKEQAAIQLRILKIKTCASLSGRASLTYHVGSAESGDMCFRIWETSGKGVYSKEWVPETDIQKVLAMHDSVVALSLMPLFKVGRSVNTAGFLLAALKNEGLIAPSPGVAHRYVRTQSEAFMSEMAALIDAGACLDPAQEVAIKKTRRSNRMPAWHLEPQPK